MVTPSVMATSSLYEAPTLARTGVTSRVTPDDRQYDLVKRPVTRVSATLIALLQFDRRR
jgi:hypothetical protein